MNTAHRPPDLPALTSLRFFAAFVVIAFHYNPDRFIRLPEVVRAWFESGYEAVIFFFVLSGFIITYTYASRGTARLSEVASRSFFVARFARLAPAYYLSILVILPLIIFEAVFYGEEPGDSLVPQAVLIGAFLQSLWPPMALAWNPPLWSVSVEWCLYTSFPLLVIASRNWTAVRMLLVAFAVLVVVAIIRIWILKLKIGAHSDDWNAFVQYFPLFHVPTFFFGMALGRLQLEGQRPSTSMARWLSALSAIVLMVKFSQLFEMPEVFKSELVEAPLFGLLIIGMAQSGHLFSRLLAWPPLLFLGNISYSMYVLHEPVMQWWEVAIRRLGVGIMPAYIDFPLYFMATVAASATAYLWVEEPGRRWLRKRLGPP